MHHHVRWLPIGILRLQLTESGERLRVKYSGLTEIIKLITESIGFMILYLMKQELGIANLLAHIPTRFGGCQFESGTKVPQIPFTCIECDFMPRQSLRVIQALMMLCEVYLTLRVPPQ